MRSDPLHFSFLQLQYSKDEPQSTAVLEMEECRFHVSASLWAAKDSLDNAIQLQLTSPQVWRFLRKEESCLRPRFCGDQYKPGSEGSKLGGGDSQLCVWPPFILDIAPERSWDIAQDRTDRP